MTLDQLECSQPSVITSLKGPFDQRRRLMELGLVPGTAISVLKIAPFQDPLEVFFKNNRCILSKKEARLLEVRRLLP